MNTSSQATATPRRWLSPSTFALALLLLPLPWVKVQCGSSSVGNVTEYYETTHSGLQLALGGATHLVNGKVTHSYLLGTGLYYVALRIPGWDMEFDYQVRMRTMGKVWVLGDRVQPPPFMEGGPVNIFGGEPVNIFLLVLAYVLLLLIGFLVTVCLPLGLRRARIALTCALVAFLLLPIQMCYYRATLVSIDFTVWLYLSCFASFLCAASTFWEWRVARRGGWAHLTNPRSQWEASWRLREFAPRGSRV